MRKNQPPRQIPFDLGHQSALSRDDLIVSGANRDAVAFVESWPAWPGPVGILVGPTGSGKTHLASVWCAHSAATVFDTADLPKVGEFGFDGMENILIEDIGETPFDASGLFHLINALRAGNGSLLITARRYPSSWPIKLPDLASRLKAAATVPIGAPDDFLLSGVITKLFADRQLSVDPPVVAYLVSRMERSLVTAIRLVERIDAMALERKVRITRNLAAEAITATDAGQGAFDL